MKKTVKVIDTNGLDEATIAMIEPIMIYTRDCYENETTFVELHNSKGETIRIFPERIKEVTNINYCKDCTNDYDDPQMCKFCKNGSHQTLCQ
jgi:hypothetical protein